GALRSSMSGFRQDLYRELTNVCFALQPDMGLAFDQNLDRYSQRFQEWQKTTQHAGVVENVFLFQDAAGDSRFLRLNQATSQFEPENWPEDFAPLRSHLQAMAMMVQNNLDHHGPPEMLHIPGFMGGPGDHHGHEHQPGERRFRPHGNPLLFW